MTLADLLDSLHARDVRLQVRDGKLLVDAPAQALDETLRAALRGRREELIAALGGAQAPAVLVRQPRGALSRFPLSVSQHAFFLLDQVSPGARAFNIFALREISGALDVPRLGRALAAVVAAEDVLRTTFELREDQAWQIVAASGEAALDVVDLSALDAAAAARLTSALCDRRAAPRLDLQRGPLFRLRVLRHGATRHTLVLVLHHIIADDRSVALFLRALVRAYAGDAAALPAAAQYPDFAQWERGQLESGALEAAIAYWRGQLTRLPALLPLSAATRALGEAGCISVHAVLDAAASAPLRRLAAALQLPRFGLLLAAYQLLWALRSGQTDIAVITPASNRQLPQTEDMLGLFVNSLVLRTQLQDCTSAAALIRAAAASCQAALDARGLSLEAMEGILRRRGWRDDSLDGLARIGFNFLGGAAEESLLQVGDLQIRSLPVERSESVFQVLLVAQEQDDGLRFKLECREDLWDAAQAQAFLAQYLHLLAQLCVQPDMPLADLDALPPGEGLPARRLPPAWRSLFCGDVNNAALARLAVPLVLPAGQGSEALAAALATAAACLPAYSRPGLAGADVLYQLAPRADAQPVLLQPRGDQTLAQAAAAASQAFAADPERLGVLLLPPPGEASAWLLLQPLPGRAAWESWLWALQQACPGLIPAGGASDDGDDGYGLLPLDDDLAAALHAYCARYSLDPSLLLCGLAALAVAEWGEDAGVVLWPWPDQAADSSAPLRLAAPAASAGVAGWLSEARPLRRDVLGRLQPPGSERLLFWHPATAADEVFSQVRWYAGGKALHLGLRGTALWCSLPPGESGALRLLARLAAALRQCVCEGVAAADLHFFAAEDAQAWAALNEAAQQAWPDPDATAGDLIAAQCRRRPQACAVVAGDTRLSYAELAQASAACAAWVRGLAAGRRATVGICLARDAALPALLLGLWQAGCIAVPLDPACPPVRAGLLMRESGADFLVCSGDAGMQLASLPLPLHRLPPLSQLPAAQTLTPQLTGEAIAYVLFTSGSSGVPAGVQVHHAALSNLLQSFLREPGLGPEDCLLASTSLSFDIALLEILLPLAAGARLVIAPQPVAADPAQVLALLRDQGVTLWQATPSTFRLLLHCGWPGDARLRLLCGGEALDAELAAALLARCAQLWNVYGPTETTIWSTLSRVEDPAQARCIGRPVANTLLRIADAHGRDLPPGAPGELWIGGDGVALGYCGAARAGKFVQYQGRRWYRSGDTAVLDEGQGLRFLGRSDRQVKLRGVRLELDEIEAALNALDGVAESAVWLSHTDGVAAMLAAVAAEGLDATAVRRALQEQLPAGMLPDRIQVFARLPRLASGKLDRQRLAAEAVAAPAAPAIHGDGLEQRLAQIWAGLLGHENFRDSDNFFDVGGHSLLLVGAHAQISAAAGLEFPAIELFNHPSIASLAGFLRQQRRPAVTPEAAPLPAPAEAVPVAIIGLSARLPGAADAAQFWDNLCAGREAIRDLDADTLRAQGVPASLLQGGRYVARASTLENIEDFDADFFGLSAREAELLDPQHRLLLELCQQALEDGGHAAAQSAARIGLFAGVGISSYLIYNLWPNRAALLAQQSPLELLYANDKDYAAVRVAYLLNLRGPVLSLGTACSTGLVAVHQACASLQSGECELALAAAVKIAVPQDTGYVYAEGGIFSPDGRCRPFDSDAAGTVFGSGGGCVLLKRLDAAQRDGDEIYAVIAGSAVNNDGHAKLGFTAPSAAGQSEVIRAALARAGAGPADIGYIEAHGTGTQLGDPIEAAALQQVFAAAPLPAAPCLVGSVKSNIGHLDTAAGMAGLIKAVLSLRHGRIPASLHFSTLNPRVGWDPRRFRVAAAPQDWSAPRGRRLAGVSSFGIGGSNAHLVLRDWLPPPAAASAEVAPQLVLLSAASADGLAQQRAQLAAALDGRRDAELPAIAQTLDRGRSALRQRVALVASSVQQLRAQLADARLPVGAAAQGRGRLIFLFPGQGLGPAGGAAALYAQSPVYREAFDACAALIARHSSFDLASLLHPGDAAQTDLLQPALFAAQYSLARLLMAAGLRPTALLGHSLGEISAACIAGVFSLADAVRLVVARGRWMQAAPAGAMLSVAAGAAELQPLLVDGVEIAACNTPRLTVLSGDPAAIELAAAQLAGLGLACRPLPVTRAFHSRHMAAAAAAVGELLAGLPLQAPQLPLLSTLLGDWGGAAFADAGYWRRQTREPVRFSDCVDALQPAADDLVIELDLHGRLAGLLARPGAEDIAAPPAPAGSDARQRLLGLLGHAWRRGQALDAAVLYHDQKPARLHLPGSVFARQRYWVAREGAPAEAAAAPRRERREDWLYQPAWLRRRLAGPAAAPQELAWLLLVSDAETPLECALAEHLQAAGCAPLLLKKTPARRPALRALSLVVGAAEPAQLQQICAGLAQGADRPCRVLYGWGLDPPASADEIALILARLAPAVAGLAAAPRGCRLLALERCGGEALAGAAAAAQAAALRVLAGEQAGLHCRQLRLEEPLLQSPATGLPALLAELCSEGEDADVVLAAGERRVASYCRFDLPPAVPAPLAAGQVCVITGGLGGIGALLAGHLVQRHGCRMVLLGRSAIAGADTPAGRRLAQLRQLQPDLRYLPVDVADAAALAQALELITAELGAPALLVHAAGVADGRLAELQDAASIAAVLDAKLKGALNLLALAGERKLGRVLLCSSLTALAGDLGQYAYAAANAALDALAASAAARGLAWTSINWDTWREVGMAVDSAATGPAGEVLARLREGGLGNDDGLALFDGILGLAEERLIVSTSNLAQRLRAARPPAAAQVLLRPAYPRPALAQPPQPPSTALEQRLQQLWQQALRLEDVGVTDDYFDLGGTSLQALELADSVSAAVGLRLPPGSLLEQRSIRALAAHIEDRGGAAGAGESVLVPLAAAARASVPAMFLVHPIGGQVYLYRELAGLLAGAAAVTGLRDTERDEACSVAALAAGYLRELRWPAGAPRVLGGASFGGMVAYEMACQLAAAGQPPDLLILLDTPDAADIAGRHDDDLSLLHYLAAQMPEFAWLRAPLAGSDPAALRVLLQQSGGALAQHLRRLRRHMQAMQAYVARPYVHRALYIKAGRRRAGIDPLLPEAAWRARMPSLSLAQVDADHVSMHQAPAVTTVAALIRTALAELPAVAETGPAHA